MLSDGSRRENHDRGATAAPRSLRARLVGILVATLALGGCAGPRTFEAVLSGAVEVAPGERAAVERLLAATPFGPPQVRLFVGAEEASGAAPFLRVEGGRVTELVFSEVADAAAVADLPALRRLELAGPFPRFGLSSAAALEDLRLLSTDRALRQLELRDLPALERLAVAGGELAEGLTLGALPALYHLTLERCGLTTIPVFEAPPVTLGELFLSGNGLRDTAGLERFPELRMVRLDRNRLVSLESFPSLPRLRLLDLKGNPLPGRLELPPLPGLESLDLRQTPVVAVPTVAATVKVRLEGATDPSSFEATLARLRQIRRNGAGERVSRQAMRFQGGWIEASRGRCAWRVGSLHRAEVSCRLSFERLNGMAAARLGETDPALPFQGGGSPEVQVRLTVGAGEARLFLSESYDLIAEARVITGVSPEEAEKARLPEDRFEGYRQVTARPGRPGEGRGGISLLGSRVVLWVEAVDGEARDVTLEVEPI